MAVFRVERTGDFTVMSNYHLRDQTLSLKAKGLLSLMLSLPEDWDYTLSGLARICQEGRDAIRGAISELERAGYVQRRQTVDENGKFSVNEYLIRERPVSDLGEEPPPEGREGEDAGGEPLPAELPGAPVEDGDEFAIPEEGDSLIPPSSAFPATGNPSADKPPTGFPTERNKDTRNKEKQNTDPQSTPSFPFPFPPSPSSRSGQGRQKGRSRQGRGVMSREELDACRSQIRENIGYRDYVRDHPWNSGQVDELVELAAEAACSRRDTLRVAGEEVPQSLVRERLLSLTGEHLAYVLDCLGRNTSQVRNVRQYLITALFNAPVTMENGYAAQVSHDLYREPAS